MLCSTGQENTSAATNSAPGNNVSMSEHGKMDYQALADELTNDPLARGYAGMNDDQAAASLNALNRDLPIDSMTGDDVFHATDGGEFATLTDTEKAQWLAFCGRQTIDPFGSANVALVQHIFGGGATTVGNLQSIRTVTNGRSRGQELDFGNVKNSDVRYARGL